MDTEAYDQGHIQGAIGFNWQTQLEDTLRRDIPDQQQWEKLLSETGISNDDTLVLYGDNNNWFATFGYWLFVMYGHDKGKLKLINGGPQEVGRRGPPADHRRSLLPRRPSTRRPRPTSPCAPTAMKS